MPVLQNFTDKISHVTSAWLNQVDTLLTTIFGQATNNSQARTALFSDNPLEVSNGGTGQRTLAGTQNALFGGLPVPIASGGTGATTAGQALINLGVPAAIGFAPTPAELNVSTGAPVTNTQLVPGNMLRYGLVANSPAAATANTTIIQALFAYSVTNGPTGYFFFPNQTGNDTYYFNGPAVVRGGCHIDLNGCTLNYSGVMLAGQGSSGLFLLVHDFVVENGTISCACDPTAAASSGCALFVGGRDITGLITVFDSLLPPGGSLGRGVIRNVTIQMANINTINSGSVGIGMLGGITNVIIENVTIDCGSSVAYGIQYEWGWATNQPTLAQRQSSHMHNVEFRNIRIANCGTQDGGTGAGIALGGAYNCVIDGLYVINSPQAFNFYVGSAMFFNPWAGVDTQGAKRNITLRNIVGQNISTTGLNLQGISPIGTGYLSATIAALGHPFDYAAQTDLMHFSLDSFSIGGSCTGVLVSGPCDIRNGFVNSTGSSGSFLISDECVRFTIDNVEIRDNPNAVGIRGAAVGDVIWTPQRLKMGTISNCFIAGNNSTGIQLGSTEAVLVRNCRIGYNTLWDVTNDSVQTTGVNVFTAGNSGGVTCDNCYVTVFGGGTSYAITGTPALTNNLVNPRGPIVGSLGAWAINGIPSVANSQLVTAASAVNTYDKFAGRMAYNSSTGKLFVAQGALTTSNWISVDGLTTIMPA